MQETGKAVWGLTALWGAIFAAGLPQCAIAQSTPPVSLEQQTTIGLATNPWGIASDLAGNVYVAEGFNGEVVKFPAGCTSTSCQSVLPFSSGIVPTGVAVDAVGGVYTVDYAGGTLLQLPAGCGSVACQKTRATGLNKPVGGIAVDSLGSVYVADTGNNRILLSPYNCCITYPPTTLATGVNAPTGVAVDAQYNVYVVETISGSSPAASDLVYIASNCYTTPCQVRTPLGNVGGDHVSLDHMGNLFIGVTSPGEVLEVPAGCSSSGCFLKIPVSGLSGPVGVTFDGAGKMYVSDYYGSQIIERAISSVNVGTASVGSYIYYTITYRVGSSSPNFSPYARVLTAGDYPADFGWANQTCSGTMANNSICTVSIAFTPRGPGLRSGVIEVLDSAQHVLLTTNVSGTGMGPGAVLDQATPVILTNALKYPTDVALDGSGDVFVADGGNNRVIEIPSGCTSSSCQITAISGVTGAAGLAIDGMGNIYTSTGSGGPYNTLMRFPPNCTSFSCGTPLGQILPESKLFIDRNGNLLVSTNAQGCYSRQGQCLQEVPWGCTSNSCFVSMGSGYNDPIAVAGDAQGNVYSLDGITGELNILASNGSSSTFPLNLGTPGAMTLDSVGNIYIAGGNYGTFSEIPVGCQSSACFLNTKIRNDVPGPFFDMFLAFESIAVDPAGNFYAVDYTDGLLVLLPRATTGGLTYDPNQVFQPDEPQTVTLHNFGNQTLNLHSFNVSPSSYSATGCSVTSLAAGTSCAATINFTPRALGTITGTATFSDDALNANSLQTVNLTGVGQPGQIHATVITSPTGLNMTVDGIPYGTTQTFTWTMGTAHSLSVTTPQAAGLPGVQYVFAGWSDGTLTTADSVTAPLTDITYTATFNTAYQLSTSAGAGGTVSPASGSYYNANTVINLTATANPGYTFTGWSGPVANPNSATTTVTMSGVTSVTANFAQVVPVTVGASPANASFTVDGTTYTSPQTMSWAAGSQHTLAATSPQSPGAGTQYSFASWSDNGAQSHQVTVSPAVTSYTATFNTLYQLTTSAGTGGSVMPATGQYYAANSNVNLTATSNPGYAFSSWSGSVANANSASTTVTMSAPQTVAATFVATVQVTIGTSPSGLSFSIDGTPYTSAQTVTWPVGANHTIATTSPQTPTPGTQNTFTNWSDGGALLHQVTASAGVTSYTAIFTTQYQLTTSAGAGGTVTPTSGQYFAANSVVNLSATANAGYAFASWTGSVANANIASTTVTMTGPQTVGATFNPIVQVTVGTSPSGLSFTVDGTSYSAPQTLTWILGSQHSIGSTQQQTPSPGTQDTFGSWSDGGALSHTVTAAAAITGYTATFNIAYQLTTSADAGGSVMPVSGQYYAANTVVPLTASANANYTFTNWTGSVANPNNASTTVTMSSPQTVAAHFAAPVQVTVGTSPGSQPFSVDGTSYGSPQTLTWIVGSQHSIAALSQPPANGTQYTFASWSDGGTASHQVTASAAVVAYTANYNTLYQLTTGSTPAAGGSVSPATGAYYPANSIVNLTGTPAAGYVFSNWSGTAANPSSASTTATMTGPLSVTAVFTPVVQVTVGTSPAGLSFTVDGTTYSSAQKLTWVVGSQHSLGTTATQAPLAGTQDGFASWSDGGALSHVVTASLGVTAYAASFNTSYQLTVTASPAAGGTVSPAGGAYFPAGSIQQVNATASAGYYFTGWTGPAANPSSPSTSVILSGPISLIASFQSAISVSPSTIALGTVYQGVAQTSAVTVSNLGTAAIAVSGAAIAGVTNGNANEFTVTNGCPKSLPGGGSCTITVSFTGGAYYLPQSAALRITDGAPDSPQSVAWSATVIDPQVEMGSTKLSYPTLKVGQTGSNPVTLKNTGGTTLTISGITITGPNATDFTFSSTCGSSLAPGASCTLMVVFAPLETGSLSANLVVVDNALPGSQTVALSGKAH